MQTLELVVAAFFITLGGCLVGVLLAAWPLWRLPGQLGLRATLRHGASKGLAVDLSNAKARTEGDPSASHWLAELLHELASEDQASARLVLLHSAVDEAAHRIDGNRSAARSAIWLSLACTLIGVSIGVAKLDSQGLWYVLPTGCVGLAACVLALRMTAKLRDRARHAVDGVLDLLIGELDAGEMVLEQPRRRGTARRRRRR